MGRRRGGGKAQGGLPGGQGRKAQQKRHDETRGGGAGGRENERTPGRRFHTLVGGAEDAGDEGLESNLTWRGWVRGPGGRFGHHSGSPPAPQGTRSDPSLPGCGRAGPWPPWWEGLAGSFLERPPPQHARFMGPGPSSGRRPPASPFRPTFCPLGHAHAPPHGLDNPTTSFFKVFMIHG